MRWRVVGVEREDASPLAAAEMATPIERRRKPIHLRKRLIDAGDDLMTARLAGHIAAIHTPVILHPIRDPLEAPRSIATVHRRGYRCIAKASEGFDTADLQAPIAPLEAP